MRGSPKEETLPSDGPTVSIDKAIVENQQTGSPGCQSDSQTESPAKRRLPAELTGTARRIKHMFTGGHLGSDCGSQTEARMKWCPIPTNSPERPGKVYKIIAERGTRREKKSNEDGSAYAHHVADGDVLPFDINRVHLANPIQGNDYINASWITEPAFEIPADLLPPSHHPQPQHAQTWIASQGPLDETGYEFFRLFFHPDPARRPKVIIQLTACMEGSRVKCANYIPSKEEEAKLFRPHRTVPLDSSSSHPKTKWALPEPDEMRNLGFIRVTLEGVESGPVQPPATNSFYHKNKLLVELLPYQDEYQQKIQPIAQARVVHYECISWYDHGTPEFVEPILELISSAKADSMISSPEESTPRTSPILVHCSAGVGRTGTLIAIASCTAQLALLNSCHLSERTLKANIISHLILPQLVPENSRIAQLPEWLNDDLVARTVDFLREQRVLMVQTAGQLDYIYKAVACFAASLS
ncbi:hypothetical protein PGTUg99_016167 [Puccinia graminis f. sp. tritici]|uniref:Uncharacterized protein n=1 Tax=Puccinia graminis f. sp. tritici TaxID=56615 RepID=A0A5B0NKY6_PUCGR|nr:hypothetical protein PGTUg99_016167 [Puccinia graminis f. sp. tritici]